MGSLEIFVANASNVPNLEKLGKSDPYVTAIFQGVKKKTEVKKGDLNPSWNEKLVFELQGAGLIPGDDLKIILKDWERVGTNRLLGQSTVSLKNFLAGQKSQKLSLSLTDGAGRPTSCTLNIQISYTAPPGTKPGAPSSGAGTVVPQVDDDDEEDDEEEGFDESGQPVKKKKKKKRMGARKNRAPVSDKPQDFQVRIKVVEARQLPGANISPVSRITCYNQTKQTRIKKSTNSPFWNEVFFFNYFCSPAELFDQLVEFGVYNSRKLRSDALIGNFKCDVGMIWDEPQHSFLHKWLLLSDPDDHMAGAKGYLKICASVLGPGDDAPSFKPSGDEDDEDIESNLLRPAGVQLRPATFVLRLYRAEDIPRMDSNVMQGIKNVFGAKDEKQFVDPYFVFSFAGQEVKSRIMYNNDHPEWNQELRLGLRFPSMCERIKLQLFDWDRISDSDAVATAYVKINQISSTTYQDGS